MVVTPSFVFHPRLEPKVPDCAVGGVLIHVGCYPCDAHSISMSWWCHGRCHRMANLWGRWTLVDPGRGSELKNSHGEDPVKPRSPKN